MARAASSAAGRGLVPVRARVRGRARGPALIAVLVQAPVRAPQRSRLRMTAARGSDPARAPSSRRHPKRARCPFRPTSIGSSAQLLDRLLDPPLEPLRGATAVPGSTLGSRGFAVLVDVHRVVHELHDDRRGRGVGRGRAGGRGQTGVIRRCGDHLHGRLLRVGLLRDDEAGNTATNADAVSPPASTRDRGAFRVVVGAACLLVWPPRRRRSANRRSRSARARLRRASATGSGVGSVVIGSVLAVPHAVVFELWIPAVGGIGR